MSASCECDPVNLWAPVSSSSVQAFLDKLNIYFSAQIGKVKDEILNRHISTSDWHLEVESRVETHSDSVSYGIGWILRKESYQQLIDNKKLLEGPNRLGQTVQGIIDPQVYITKSPGLY